MECSVSEAVRNRASNRSLSCWSANQRRYWPPHLPRLLRGFNTTLSVHTDIPAIAPHTLSSLFQNAFRQQWIPTRMKEVLSPAESCGAFTPLTHFRTLEHPHSFPRGSSPTGPRFRHIRLLLRKHSPCSCPPTPLTNRPWPSQRGRFLPCQRDHTRPRSCTVTRRV